MYQVCVSPGYGMMPEDIANKKSLSQHWTPRSARVVTSGAEAVWNGSYGVLKEPLENKFKWWFIFTDLYWKIHVTKWKSDIISQR